MSSPVHTSGWRSPASLLGFFVTLALAAGIVARASGQCEVTKLLASDGTSGDSFGRSVFASGDVLVIGAHEANDEAGAAYIFRRTPDTLGWVEEQQLLAASGNRVGEGL